MLEGIFRWWEMSHPKIAPHDKLLFSVGMPVVLALLGYLGSVALGDTVWMVPGVAQALYVGVLAFVGSQLTYGGVKKWGPQVLNMFSVSNNTTNIDQVQADQDVYVGSTRRTTNQLNDDDLKEPRHD